MTSKAGWAATRLRWTVLAIVAVLALGSASVYAWQAFNRYQQRTTGASAAQVVERLPSADRIVFRNTAPGSGYGMVASVSLTNLGGPRELGDTACDRVDAEAGIISCMRILRGIPTTFETRLLDANGDVAGAWPLSGIPSRTRISSEGLVGTTAFVTGHSYATDSFSTETTIRDPDGVDYGNLEDFTMIVEGEKLTAIDRNVWGVTFASENDIYATVASGGKTWLVKGDLDKRTLTSMMMNAECPSVSPDRTKVAYKKRSTRMGLVHWDIAVLDLATKLETVIQLKDGFDDQLEWLDEDTLLFGMPRQGAVGDSDVYSIKTVADAQPQLLIEHAWSPSVELVSQ